MIGHLFSVAIREWRLGLVQNPVANIRKPSPGKGRDRRLGSDEEKRLREAIRRHSKPMLRWIFEIAIEIRMRSAEITGLRVEQVDLARRVVRLRDTKNENARTVQLTKWAAVVLAEAIANPLRSRDCDLFFLASPAETAHVGPTTSTIFGSMLSPPSV